MACFLPSSCLVDSSPSTSNSAACSFPSIPQARSLWLKQPAVVVSAAAASAAAAAAAPKLNFPNGKRQQQIPLSKQQMKWEKMMLEMQASQQPAAVLKKFFTDGTTSRDVVIGTLSKLKQNKSWKLLIEFTEWLMEEGWYKFNQRDYFLLLLAYCKDGQVRKMEELLGRLQALGVAPSIEMFTLQIEAYGRNRELEKAESIFQKLLASGPPPTALTYQTLMKSYSEAGRLADVQRLFKSVTEGGNQYVRPDARMYNLMLHTYGRLGKTNEALSMYRSMKHFGIPLTVVTFNSLLACQKTWREAENIFKKLRAANVAPDGFTYTSLLNAYAKARRVESAQTVFNEMIDAGVKPTQVAYNALINAYAKCKDPEGARKTLKAMRLSGLVPSVESYTSLVEAYTSMNLMAKAEQVVLRMQEAGVRPNLATFCVLMAGYASGNKLDFMTQSYEKLKLAGLQPNQFVYTVLINAYGSNDDFDAAVIWYKQMVEDGFKPDSVLRKVLLKVASDPEQRAEARGLLANHKSDDGSAGSNSDQDANASEGDTSAAVVAETSSDDEASSSSEEAKEDSVLLVPRSLSSAGTRKEELVAS